MKADFKSCSKWVLLLVVNCIAVVPATSSPSGDTRNWKTHRVDIDQQFVSFTIPPDESRDFPAFEIPKRIRTAEPGVFGQDEIGPKLLNRYWDYRDGRFAAVEGTLHAYIVLWHSERELRDTAALMGASEENAELVRMKELMTGGTGGPSDVRRYVPVTVAGKDGLLVHHSITSETYVAPLDLHHYLSISVRNSVTHPRLRAEAQAAADTILKSIKIEPK